MSIYAEFDTSFSLAMLKEALKNPKIKHVLNEVATPIRSKILSLLIAQEWAGLSPNLDNLASQHSMNDKFLGALLPEYSVTYLAHTHAGRMLLLNSIDNCLRNAMNIRTRHDFIAFMKVIDGMAFVYDMLKTDEEDPVHRRYKDHIAPKIEELNIRAHRPEDYLAKTYGIGTEIGYDLILNKKESTGCLSGKARYFITPVLNFPQTLFEKLASENSNGKPTLPLIAGPSNSTAKSLMMAQSLNVFLKNNNLFDQDKAQIFVNCLMAYLVYCGHHSVCEIIEIWDRLLNFLMIEGTKPLPHQMILMNYTTWSFFDEIGVAELKFPHNMASIYRGFLHPIYSNNVIEQTIYQLKKGLNLQFENEVYSDDTRKKHKR